VTLSGADACTSREKTKVLPVIAVPITNDVTNENLLVTEVIKIVFPNAMGREGTETVPKTDSPSKEGWVTSQRRKGDKASRLAVMIRLQERLCHGM
jgi:hypothetical protein